MYINYHVLLKIIELLIFYNNLINTQLYQNTPLLIVQSEKWSYTY